MIALQGHRPLVGYPVVYVLTVFFYHSDVKEASGMLNIPFRLALIDTLDLIKEAFSKKTTRVLFQFCSY